MDKIPMTAEGYSTLENELKHRQQVERPRIIQLITDARTHGDLSENAEYHAAKESQSHNEGRIADLEDKLARAEVIDVSKLSGETIKFGATVTLVDEDTEKKQVWQLVGEPEADAKKGKISITSPLARAEVIDVSKLSGDTIKFGATVTLVDEDTEKKQVWQLVGEPEADAKKGKISITSPLARALIGKAKGANVEVVTPSGAKAYEIKKVEWR